MHSLARHLLGKVMDDLVEALANPSRRRLLVALTDHNPRNAMLTLEDVHEGDTDGERLHVEMYHVHLPKLEENGLIEWDRRTHEVVKGPRFDEIRPLLSSIDSQTDPSDDPVTDSPEKV